MTVVQVRHTTLPRYRSDVSFRYLHSRQGRDMDCPSRFPSRPSEKPCRCRQKSLLGQLINTPPLHTRFDSTAGVQLACERRRHSRLDYFTQVPGSSNMVKMWNVGQCSDTISSLHTFCPQVLHMFESNACISQRTRKYPSRACKADLDNWTAN